MSLLLSNLEVPRQGFVYVYHYWISRHSKPTIRAQAFPLHANMSNCTVAVAYNLQARPGLSSRFLTFPAA